MIDHEILEAEGIVIVEPGTRLSAEDFVSLAKSVDAYLADHERLNGLLIHMEAFPGWEDLAGLIQHLRFVKGHHRQIERVAFASDSRLASLAPPLARHFVSAEVRHFGYDEREKALQWLSEGGQGGHPG